jgi:hypothetical protein
VKRGDNPPDFDLCERMVAVEVCFITEQKALLARNQEVSGAYTSTLLAGKADPAFKKALKEQRLWAFDGSSYLSPPDGPRLLQNDGQFSGENRAAKPIPL